MQKQECRGPGLGGSSVELGCTAAADGEDRACTSATGETAG